MRLERDKQDRNDRVNGDGGRCRPTDPTQRPRDRRRTTVATRCNAASRGARNLLRVRASLCLLGTLACLGLTSCTIQNIKRRDTFWHALDAGDLPTVRAMLDRGEPVNGHPK